MKKISLGTLEHQVMNILWKKGEVSIPKIHADISKNKGLAYTTTATVVQRLYEKGMLKKIKRRSKIFYLPKLSKEVFGKSVAQSFLRSYLHTFGDSAFTSFAQSINELPADKKEDLLHLIKLHGKKT